MNINVKNFIRKNLKWIVLFICLIGFLAIAEDVFEKEIMKKYIIGYYLVSKFLIADKLTPIAKVITSFGGATVLLSLTILVFALVKDKKIVIAVAINLCISTLLNILLKNILQRPRPTEYRLINETRI